MRCYCHICVVVQNQSIKHLHTSADEWAGVNKETTDVSYIFCAIPQENRMKFEHSDKTSLHMHRLLLGVGFMSADMILSLFMQINIGLVE